MTRGTAPTNFETSVNDDSPLKGRRSSLLTSDDYDMHGQGTIGIKKLLNDRRMSMGSRGILNEGKRSQSMQRNSQVAAMVRTAPQGGFYKPPTTAVPQTAIGGSPRGYN